MRYTATIAVELPDGCDLRDKEIAEAMEGGLRNAVVGAYEMTLPVEHQSWHHKYRNLSDEVKYEVKQQTWNLNRNTTVVIQTWLPDLGDVNLEGL